MNGKDVWGMRTDVLKGWYYVKSMFFSAFYHMTIDISEFILKGREGGGSAKGNFE